MADSSEFFTRAELECSHCGQCMMNEQSLVRLDALRAAHGDPLLISSAYRCPDHNEAVSSTGRDGPHTTGQAVDLLISGAAAFDIVARARLYGFRGIGVSQKGPHESRFVHLDDLDDAPGRPRPWLWSYA
jgi:uncharacterized protein YcbK (DUF882 family)